MRHGRPSQTASIIAVLRALADAGDLPVPGFSDPVSAELLGPGWRGFGRVLSRRLRRMKPARRAKTLARLSLVPLRVLAIDAELFEAVAAGTRQVVILGAGLDTRAWRMPALGEATVYEVDHPASQRWKRGRVARLAPCAAFVRFVPVDFETGDLATALDRAGHDAAAPTVWIWEGVVVYLTDAAFDAGLDGIASRSAPRSRAVIQYHAPGRHLGQDLVFRRMILGLFGEAQVGFRSRNTLAAALAHHGLEVLRDTGAGDWARAVGAPPPAGDEAERARIVVARRP